MQQEADLVETETEAGRRLGDAGHQPDRGIVRRRRCLEAMKRTARLVEDLKVGESAADIDADADGASFGRHAASRLGGLLDNHSPATAGRSISMIAMWKA